MWRHASAVVKEKCMRMKANVCYEVKTINSMNEMCTAAAGEKTIISQVKTRSEQHNHKEDEKNASQTEKNQSRIDVEVDGSAKGC